MLNRVQSANRNEQQNRKTEVFWQKTDLKAAKTAKSKIPMPPSRLPSSMAALHNTPRYSRESDYMEPFGQKKLSNGPTLNYVKQTLFWLVT